MTPRASRGSAAHAVMRSVAMWMTASMPRVTLRTASTSRMSPRTRVTRRSVSACSMLASVPRFRLSKMTMRPGACSCSRRSTVVEPMRPQPPVTRILAPLMSMVGNPLCSIAMCSSLLQRPGGVARDSRRRRDIPDDVATDADKCAGADADSMHDAGAAADVAVLAEHHPACDRHVGTDEAAMADDRVVVHDGVWQDAHVVADPRVARDHDAGHE